MRIGGYFPKPKGVGEQNFGTNNGLGKFWILVWKIMDKNWQNHIVTSYQLRITSQDVN